MFKKMTALLTAAGLFFMPTTLIHARGGAQSPVMEQVGPTADQRMALVEAVLPGVLEDEGFDVGIHSDLQRDAVLRAFGADALEGVVAINLPSLGELTGIALIPTNVDALRDGNLSLALFEGDDLKGAFDLQMRGDKVRFSMPDGRPVVDIAVATDEDGYMAIDFDAARTLTIMAIDLPDFSLDPLIDALQGVLDILYTIKGLLNSIICAVNSAINLMYGLDGCGVGTTTIGGGALFSHITCSVGPVKNFINSVKGCF